MQMRRQDRYTEQGRAQGSWGAEAGGPLGSLPLGRLDAFGRQYCLLELRVSDTLRGGGDHKDGRPAGGWGCSSVCRVLAWYVCSSSPVLSTAVGVVVCTCNPNPWEWIREDQGFRPFSAMKAILEYMTSCLKKLQWTLVLS